MPDRLDLTLERSELAFVAGCLNVLIRWDARSCARLLIRPTSIGLFAATPTGCVIFLAVPLVPDGQPVESPREVTVATGRLRDVIGDVGARHSGASTLRVPDEVGTPIDLLSLPPMTGWVPITTDRCGNLQRIVDDARQEFADRAEVAADQAGVDRVAQEVWDRRVFGPAPIRSVHTAAALGWLARPETHAQAATVAGWTRLATPAGLVFASDQPTRLTLPVSVVGER